MRRLALNAAVAVDLVILTLRADELCVLTITRGIDPFVGKRALPGGFIHDNEDLLEAALRELREETGVAALRSHLEQLGTYGVPKRDPRGRVVSVAYLALVPDQPEPMAGSDANGSAWTPTQKLIRNPNQLAFDHTTILRDGIERARAKLEYTPLATAFCGSTFTIGELRHVYEVIWGTPLDPRNFHRKVTGTPGFVVPTSNMATKTSGRPAQLYRCGRAQYLHPPLMRPTATSVRNERR